MLAHTQIVLWSKSKVPAFLVVFLYTGAFKKHTKVNQAAGQNRARMGAYRVVQTLYWKCIMHSAYSTKRIVLLMRDSARERHIDWSTFYAG